MGALGCPEIWRTIPTDVLNGKGPLALQHPGGVSIFHGAQAGFVLDTEAAPARVHKRLPVGMGRPP